MLKFLKFSARPKPVSATPVSETASPLALATACITLFIAMGCNFFSPLADDDKDLDYRGLIIKGSEAINRGRYAKAQEYFEQAKRINPAGSEAYLFHSKALMYRYGLDFSALNDEFKSKRGEDGGTRKKGIPFLDSTTTLAGMDSIFYPIATSVRNLEHILRQKIDTIFLQAGSTFMLLPDGDTAGDGRVSPGVARLDLGLLLAIKAMLAPMDLDGNDHIDADCGRNLCPAGDETCRQSLSYLKACKEGPVTEAVRFDNFKKLTKNLNIDSLSGDDINARHVSTDPNDINAFLDAMQGPIAGSNHNLDTVDSALRNHNENKLSDQLQGIVVSIKDLDHFLGYMRYNDSADNDADYVGEPQPEKSIMVWHDFNKDGAIRFNYDETFPGYPPEAGDLGHPLHRHLKPILYLGMAEYKLMFPALAADTSVNSRISLMIRHCRDRVAKLADTEKITADLKEHLSNFVCSTTTSIVKPDIKPPMGRSDWVGGPYGVDEEALDDRDNDMDGLKDEDTRNARGLDDDDDAALHIGLLGKVIEPMAWKDASGHRNACVDIDTLMAMDPENPRQFCIGTLEHRLHLARTSRDSLLISYSTFDLPEQAPNKNCMDDIEKLDVNYLLRQNFTFEEKVLACRYKHIWILPRPPRSEWSSGILGIDEEIADGIDNDGDGWIDEDLR